MTKTDLIIPLIFFKNGIKNSLNSIFKENNFINKIILIIDGCDITLFCIYQFQILLKKN